MAKWIFVFCFVITCFCPLLDLRITPHIGPSIVWAEDAASMLGCEIRVLNVSFWRDFMPIVSRPGPDGGSPLHARIKLILDNSRGAGNRFLFRAVVLDGNGQPYPVSFRVPHDRADFDPNLDGKSKRTLGTVEGATWIEIKESEVREIELLTDEGPYLQVGSSVHVEIRWTGLNGAAAVVRSPVRQIKRTD